MDIQVVIPTRNEPGIGILVRQLLATGFPVLVVDDSDGPETLGLAIAAGAVGMAGLRRGLSPAVRLGAAMCSLPYILVMDGDGQHRPEDALRIAGALRSGSAQVVIGSRFAHGAQLSGLSAGRKMLSRTLNIAANTLAKTKCSDPMTGFAAVPRRLMLQTQTLGYKWLFEILLNNRLRVGEVPIQFAPRTAGASKASPREILQIVRTPRW